MEVHFSPDLQTRLNRVAADNSSDTDAYVQQLVEHYLDHDAWFRQNVKKGLEQLDRGVQKAQGTIKAIGQTLERKAVHEKTWAKILDALKALPGTED